MSRTLIRILLPLTVLVILGVAQTLISSDRVDAQEEPAPADTTATEGGAFHFDVAKVGALTGGMRIDVGPAFAEATGRALTVMFTLNLPVAKEIKIHTEDEPENGSIIKFNFATIEDPPRLIENLFFIEATAASGSERERLAALGRYLDQQVFAQATRDFTEVKKVALRRVMIGSYPAAELSGSYVEPNLGPMNLRILAIPDPDSERAVIVISNGVGKLLPLGHPDLFPMTFAGKAMATFRFLPQQ